MTARARVKVPPIKCQGIKTKLVPWIVKHVNLPIKGNWIEPFTGSGVVGFNLRPRKAIFNDLNPYPIGFYKDLQNDTITPRRAREFLEDHGARLKKTGEDYFYEVRQRFNDKHDGLDFLFLSRSCFNGMIRFNRKGNFNVPFCRKPHRFTKSYITKIVNQVNWVYDAIHRNDWVFECSEFAKPIMRATEDDFVYCDPPYIARHVDYFNNWGLKEEKLLFDVLKNCKARFVLSAWHSNEFRENSAIDTYWKQFSIDTKEHFYHVGPKETNRRPIIEALIYNFEPLEIEDKTPVELTLFD